jgi:hypothetical protein
VRDLSERVDLGDIYTVWWVEKRTEQLCLTSVIASLAMSWYTFFFLENLILRKTGSSDSGLMLKLEAGVGAHTDS